MLSIVALLAWTYQSLLQSTLCTLLFDAGYAGKDTWFSFAHTRTKQALATAASAAPTVAGTPEPALCACITHVPARVAVLSQRVNGNRQHFVCGMMNTHAPNRSHCITVNIFSRPTTVRG